MTEAKAPQGGPVSVTAEPGTVVPRAAAPAAPSDPFLPHGYRESDRERAVNAARRILGGGGEYGDSVMVSRHFLQVLGLPE